MPCGPIASIDQVFADPQVKHLKMATPMHSPVIGDAEVVASAISITGFSKDIRLATPEMGSSTGRGAGLGWAFRRRDRRDAQEGSDPR